MGSRIKDKISVKSMLDKFDLLSVNQLAAQIKLQEVWKSINVEGFAIKLEPYSCNLTESGHELRQKNNRIFNDTSRLQIAEYSFHMDAAKLWNNAPIAITQAKILSLAKKAIKIHVKTLPV